MLKGDSIYQVLLRYDFDLMRGNEGIAEYINDHLNKYYSDMNEAISKKNDFLGSTFIGMLKEKMPLLNELCKDIPSVLFDFDNGHIQKAYNDSVVLFDKLKPYLLQRLSRADYCGDYYRIRQGDFRITDPTQSKQQKMELFHIKRSLRNRIGAYRYSVAGYPCLYLASDSDLAWFECGMPKQFSYCKMRITEEGENALKLVDFSFRPVDTISAFNTWVLNARRQGKEETELINYYNFLIKYIITYPLSAACSVKVKDRGAKFVQEYIIPQLFMQWIRESDDIDGVRYRSSLKSDLVKYRNAVNIALPVKSFRSDGLDENLTAKIAISDIGYMDVNKEFAKHQDVIAQIKDYKCELRQYMIASECCGDYVIELLDLCDYVVNMYTALMEGDYTNSDLLFTCLNDLCDHLYTVNKYHDAIIQESINKAPPVKRDFIELPIAKKHFEDFYKLTNKIISKNMAFNLSFEDLENFEHI